MWGHAGRAGHCRSRGRPHPHRQTPRTTYWQGPGRTTPARRPLPPGQRRCSGSRCAGCGGPAGWPGAGGTDRRSSGPRRPPRWRHRCPGRPWQCPHRRGPAPARRSCRPPRTKGCRFLSFPAAGLPPAGPSRRAAAGRMRHPGPAHRLPPARCARCPRSASRFSPPRCASGRPWRLLRRPSSGRGSESIPDTARLRPHAPRCRRDPPGHARAAGRFPPS